MIHLIPHVTLLVTLPAVHFRNCFLRSRNSILDFDFQLAVLNDLTQRFLKVAPHPQYSLKFHTDHLGFRYFHTLYCLVALHFETLENLR